MTMRSALYEGVVTHHRRQPVDHRFAYRLAMPFVFLDEMDELCDLHPLWSNERANVVSFRRADYLGDSSMALDRSVREVVQEQLGASPEGPIAMLAHPRTWGWLFNPIALYYCFDPSGTRVEALVAEVTNTPWKERHAYVVGGPGSHHVEKALHVSPFFGMDLAYGISYRPPGARLSLRISAIGAEGNLFDAALRLSRREVNRQVMGRLITAWPFMTTRVSTAIYRQAFALWRRGVPFIEHPRRAQCPAIRPETLSSGATPVASARSRPSLHVPDGEVAHG
jgi:uncharacterized protein